ncbi:MAG: hypothetical protein D4R64_06920 [Porphyromonadaceae bacterium]|nr:MAG: hypothetical protein D4R64_06920 [Porphyromonadaceae bacterium]
MRQIILITLLSISSVSISAQVLSADPDSVLAEWLEAGEWEGVSLHPDIAMDWLLDMDSSFAEVPEKRSARTHLFTVNVPVRASLLDWISDSGSLISPVSMKYRIKISEPHRWEFRFQTNQNAGDTCLAMQVTGIPQHLSTGFLIRPGQTFREIIIGDFQVKSGFGVVAGSSPVFSVSLGNPGSLHRPGKGIRLHSGTDEGRFFRGLAGSMEFGKSELIVYGSGKDRIHEDVIGISWKTSFTNSEIGFSGIRVNNQFPPEIKKGWTEAWQPDSGRYSRIGIWGQTRVPFGILFGEAGWSPNGGYGWISGIRWFEAQGFSAVLRYSGCSPGYPVTYSLFQSGTGLTKEGQRVIASYRYAPVRQFEWLGSVEVDLAQWPGSNAHFNNASTRISQQLKFLSKNLWMAAGSLQLDFLESAAAVPKKLTWKLTFDSDPKQYGTLRFRAGLRQQVQGFGSILTKGTTADCSMSADLAERRLRITGGFRVFTVETGTDPLYAYEPDVLYGWSAPVLSGSGTRWFGTVRWKLLKNIDLELKISQTAYSDLKHLSEENPGGVSGKMQVAWRIT